MKGALRQDWLRVVRAEERSILFKELISGRLGTDDVENFIAKQNGLKHSKGGGRVKGYEEDRGRVTENMVKKLEDSLQDEKERRSQRNKTRSRLELGEFTMVSQPIRLILVDWFVFHLFFKVVFHFSMVFFIFLYFFLRSSSIFLIFF